MEFNQLNLLNRMREKGESQRSLSSATGMNKSTLNLKLNGKYEFTSSEIIRICNRLEIPYSQIPRYFFQVKENNGEATQSVCQNPMDSLTGESANCKYVYTAEDTVKLLNEEIGKIEATPGNARLRNLLNLASLHLKAQDALVTVLINELDWEDKPQPCYGIPVEM